MWRSLKTGICHGHRDKIAVTDDNHNPAKQPLAYQHSVLSLHINMFTHTNTPSHNTLVFTPARNSNATSEVKSELFRTYSWISTAITKTQKPKRCLHQQITIIHRHYTTLPRRQCLQHVKSKSRMTVKTVARIRNEGAVSYCKVLFNHLPGNTKLTTSSPLWKS